MAVCRNGTDYGHGIAPCGRCVRCKVRLKRQWTARLIAEHLGQPTRPPLFVTLTYAPEQLPTGISKNGDVYHPLQKDDLATFLGELRESSKDFRYYAVGEYGERSGRPHYHLLVFPGPTFPVSLLHPSEEVWDKGYTYTGIARDKAISYVAGYCVKKICNNRPAEDAREHVPEYTKMSIRPPLGYYVADKLIDWHHTRTGATYLAKNGDVLAGFRVGGRFHPLGRTLSNRIRTALGIPHKLADRIEHPAQERAAMENALKLTYPDETNMERSYNPYYVRKVRHEMGKGL